MRSIETIQTPVAGGKKNYANRLTNSLANRLISYSFYHPVNGYSVKYKRKHIAEAAVCHKDFNYYFKKNK